MLCRVCGGTLGSLLTEASSGLFFRMAAGMDRKAQLPAMSVPKPSWIRKNAAMPKHCNRLPRFGFGCFCIFGIQKVWFEDVGRKLQRAVQQRIPGKPEDCYGCYGIYA